MRITVFGANGKVGRLVVKKALKKGFQVVAFSHGKTRFTNDDNLQIIQGDIHNIQDVDKALEASNAVISALGSWGTSSKDILTAGMKNIIPSMQRHNIKRIVSLTGADAFAEGESYNIFHKLTHLLISLFAKKIMQDGENHIMLLKNSGLKWTVVRSPVMNEAGEAKNFILTTKKIMPWSTINRNSVAQCLLDQIDDDSFIQHSPYLKRTKI